MKITVSISFTSHSHIHQNKKSSYKINKINNYRESTVVLVVLWGCFELNANTLTMTRWRSPCSPCRYLFINTTKCWRHFDPMKALRWKVMGSPQLSEFILRWTWMSVQSLIHLLHSWCISVWIKVVWLTDIALKCTTCCIWPLFATVNFYSQNLQLRKLYEKKEVQAWAT